MNWDIASALVALLVSALVVPVFAIRRYWGWAGVCLLVAALTGTLLATVPTLAWVGTVAFLLLIVCPMVGVMLQYRTAMQMKYATAARIARWLRLLHPFDGWWTVPVFYEALAAAQHGDLDGAEALLRPLNTTSSSVGRDARFYLYRLRGAWEECAAWLQDTVTEQEIERNGTLMLYFTRTLGETGQLSHLLELVTRRRSFLRRLSTMIYYHVLLYTFVFCGHTAGVDAVLQSRWLAVLAPAAKAFWQASAAMAAGHIDASDRLAALQQADDAALRAAVTRRITHPLTPALGLLTPEDARLLDELYRALMAIPA